ncbi:MAG TPA: S9 family peptidase, partial [Steroidobacteraceae bacterium]|nr:S9 family peptidase [Steroidobacteraceae bacterium]
IIDVHRDSPDTVLIAAPDSDAMGHMQYGAPAVWELNVYTGQLKKRAAPHASIANYYSDGKGNLRLAIGYANKSTVYFARRKGESEWRELAKVKPFSPLQVFVPIEVIPDTNNAYAIGPSGDRAGLWLIDLEDKQAPQLLFDHPIADVSDPIVDTEDGKLLGVVYELDRPFIYYTNERLGALMEAVKKQLPDTFNVVTGTTRDGSKLVIRATSDREAGTFYLYDTATKTLTRIGKRYPELDVAQLPRMRSIEYSAADGVKIPGYLTTPFGAREEKLPLIVLPHGGPIARDHEEFNFLRLFLASRGYAVLQMEFRGSAGYGFQWQIAAHQDWGGLTYSDIVDGARWAIAQGIADPNRMCIVGWSFGGYAALTGAVRNPDLFKCSASIAGLSDLSQLLKSYPGGSVAWEQIGTDPEKLKANSPAKHADEVKMPVLMLHGTLDAQAAYRQSEEMADALKKAGKNFKFVTIKDADHSLWRESERTTLLTELEQFLSANLGPGVLAAK